MPTPEKTIWAAEVILRIKQGRDVELEGYEIEGELCLRSMHVQGRLKFLRCTFTKHFSAPDACFERTVEFTQSVFRRGLAMPGAKFKGGLWLNHVKIEIEPDQHWRPDRLFKQADVNLRGIKVSADCNASYLEIGLGQHHDAWPKQTQELKSQPDFEQFKKWVGKKRAASGTMETDALPRCPSLILDSAEFGGLLRLDGACIAGNIEMENAHIKGNLSARVPQGDLRWPPPEKETDAPSSPSKPEAPEPEGSEPKAPKEFAGRPTVVHGRWNCDGFDLGGNFAGQGLRVREGLSLRDATVDGEIFLDVDEGPGSFSNPAEPRKAFSAWFGSVLSQSALRFRGIRLRGSIRLSGATVLGTIDLFRAEIGGRFRLAAWSYQRGDEQTFENKVRHSKVLNHEGEQEDKRPVSVRAAQASIKGGVHFEGADFHGDVDLSGAKVGDGFRAGVWTHEDPDQSGKVSPVRTCFRRDLLLPLAEIQGHVNLRGAWIRGRFNAENMRVHGSFHAHVWHERVGLDRAKEIERSRNQAHSPEERYGQDAGEKELVFRFEWSTGQAARASDYVPQPPASEELSRTFSLYGATVDEDFFIMGARLQGIADLTGIKVGGSLFARTELLTLQDLCIENEMESGQPNRVRHQGRLLLVGAVIKHSLHLHGAQIGCLPLPTTPKDGKAGPLLDLDNARIGEDLRAGELEVGGAISMKSLKVGGQALLGGLNLHGELSLQGAGIDGDLSLKQATADDARQTFRVGPAHEDRVITLSIPLHNRKLQSSEEVLKFEWCQIKGSVFLGSEMLKGEHRALKQISFANSHVGGLELEMASDRFVAFDLVSLNLSGCQTDRVPVLNDRASKVNARPSDSENGKLPLLARMRCSAWEKWRGQVWRGRVSWSLKWAIRWGKALFLPVLGVAVLSFCLHGDDNPNIVLSFWFSALVMIVAARLVWWFEKVTTLKGIVSKDVSHLLERSRYGKFFTSERLKKFRGVRPGLEESGQDKIDMQHFFYRKAVTGILLGLAGLAMFWGDASRLLSLVLWAWAFSNFCRYFLHGWLKRLRNKEEEHYNRKSPALRWISLLRSTEGDRTSERAFFMQVEKLLRAAGKTTLADSVYLRMEHWSVLGDRSPQEMSESHRFLASFFFVTCGYGVRWQRIMTAWCGALLLSVLLFWDPGSVELTKVYPAEYGLTARDLARVKEHEESNGSLRLSNPQRVLPAWLPDGGATNYVYNTDGPNPEQNELASGKEKGSWGGGARLSFAMRTMIPMIPQFAWDDYDPTSGNVECPTCVPEWIRQHLRSFRSTHYGGRLFQWIRACPVIPTRYDTMASVLETFSWVCLSLLLVSCGGWLKRRE